MNKNLYISYLRVSTQKQGEDGYGIIGQRKIVLDYVNSVDGLIMNEYVEVESGRKNNRVELEKALAECKKINATLVISKLDRLGRNAAFLISLAESCVKFIAVDNQELGKNKLLLCVMAGMAEMEAEAIRTRVKEALAVAKAKGVVLGGWRGTEEQAKSVSAKMVQGHKERAAERVKAAMVHINKVISDTGITSYNFIATELNKRGILTDRNCKWYSGSVKQVMNYELI